jgi:hypothetical protein
VPWRAALCLLLAALSLYNPFFTIYGVSDISNVRHPLSYRATVASSELRRGTVNPVKSAIPRLAVLVTRERMQAATAYPVALARPQDFFRSVPQVICSSLWFRPPPAL